MAKEPRFCVDCGVDISQRGWRSDRCVEHAYLYMTERRKVYDRQYKSRPGYKEKAAVHQKTFREKHAVRRAKEAKERLRIESQSPAETRRVMLGILDMLQKRKPAL